MATPTELADLLTRCSLDDRRAFELLYQQTSAQLFGLVLRIVKDQELARDVLQEGYIKIWTHAGAYRADKATAMTWMGSIVRNQAIDLIRRTSSRPVATESVDDLYWLEDGTAGPPELVSRGEEDEVLRECIRQLQGAQRTAMLLAYFKGLTHEEIASQLGTPLGTVKSWLRRGLLRLKKCLEQS